MTNATPRFTPNFIQVTPFMIVEDLEKALAFFVDLLDFELQLRWPDYAYVQRETAGFRIWQQTGKDAAPPGTRRFAYYIDVQDVDRLYAELKPKLDLLPAERRPRPRRQAVRPARAASAGSGRQPARLWPRNRQALHAHRGLAHVING